MPRHPLYRATNKYGEDYSEEYLTDDPTFADSAVEDTLATLEELADYSDQDAESCNNHEYVGTHRALAALLHRELGREKATFIMRQIAEYGGLDGMSGVGGKDEAFPDFNIQDCWHEWSLPQ